MDFGSDSLRSLLWNISAFVAFVCFCSKNDGLTGGGRTGTEFEQKAAKVTKGGAEDENGGRLMRAGGARQMPRCQLLARRPHGAFDTVIRPATSTMRPQR